MAGFGRMISISIQANVCMGNQAATWADRMPNLRDRIVQTIDDLEIDVLILCESGFAPPELVAALNKKTPESFHYPDSNSSRIQIYARRSASLVSDQFNDSSDGRMSIRRITTASNTEILLAAIHFKVGCTGARQTKVCRQL